jgi:protoporphyrinogen oxidase
LDALEPFPALPQPRLVVIGGGPSGMAAALEAVRQGASPIVLERLDQVGGLARTIRHDGNRFDIGPHRFFTLNPEIKQLFIEVCGDDLVRVPRLTRIFYKGVYFNYPLTPFNALFGLGIGSSVAVIASYAAARLRRLFRSDPPQSFEEWIVDRFGKRLYRTFFKTYTEKVWGIPCTRIGADWAEQRIKGLSLSAAVMNALFRPKRKTIKTLVDEFLYPRLGAGQLYEKMQQTVETGGGNVRTGTEVVRVRRDGFRVQAIECRDASGESYSLTGDFYLSSAPLTELIGQLDPPAPPEVLAAVQGLRYRNHVGVNVVVKGAAPFADNWIYVHSPDVKMARISDYRNFSSEMSASEDTHPLTVEYFCFPDDEIWTSSDAALIERATAELAKMGISAAAAEGGFVVRSEKAYPVIERGYQEKIDTIKAYLDQFENLLPIGRSGMFKYNNQDHAMATGIYATRMALGRGRFDPWLVNIDGVYQESGQAV